MRSAGFSSEPRNRGNFTALMGTACEDGRTSPSGKVLSCRRYSTAWRCPAGAARGDNTAAVVTQPWAVRRLRPDLPRQRPDAIQLVWLSTAPLLPQERDAVSPRGARSLPPAMSWRDLLHEA